MENGSLNVKLALLPIAIVLALVFVALPAALGPAAEAADDVAYIDEKGNVSYASGVTVIDVGYFAGAPKPYVFDGTGPGTTWFLIDDTGSVNIDGPVYINGSVAFIMADAVDLQIKNESGPAVIVDGDFYVYDKPDTALLGKITATNGDGVHLSDGSSLTNTAVIAANGTAVKLTAGGTVTNSGQITMNIPKTSGPAYGVYLGGEGTITNSGLIKATAAIPALAYGVCTDGAAATINEKTGQIQGTIHGIWLKAGGTVENYGTVESLKTGTFYAIYAEGTEDVAITNYDSGLIKGVYYGIGMAAGNGSTLDNYGTIKGGYEASCVSLLSYATVTNKGLLDGSHSGISVANDGLINNFGTINGPGMLGNAVFASKKVTVINEESGILNGGYTTIRFLVDGTVINYGTIQQGTHGVVIDKDGTVINYGTIKGNGSYGVCSFVERASANVILVNYATINAVYLKDNGSNNVTLVSGSTVLSNFIMNTDPGSKLTFSGDPGALLKYTTAGTTVLGNVIVGIDPVGLPAGLQVGDKIVLIDASARTMTGTVSNPVLTVCCYTLAISIEDNKLIAIITEVTKEPDIPDPPEPPVPPEPPEPPGGGGGGGEQPEKYHYITATAGSGAVINPMGETKVTKGGNKIFYFSALAVYVDGVPLSDEEVALGYYRFVNVNANHSIYAVGQDGSRELIYLTIDIKQGKGHAGFTLNGLTYTDYSRPVPLQYGVNLLVSACPDDGYSFKEWRYDGKVLTENAQTFNNVTGSIHLDLYFAENSSIGGIFDSDGGFPWLLVSIIILLASGFILWIVFFYRRYYEVAKPGNGRVVGKDRAHRKSEYEFTVEGGFTGKAFFRIGDEGEWTAIQPGPEGKYLIPRGLVIDKVAIELR